MPRAARFLFGRLNLIGQYDNKADFVLRGLRTRQLLPYRGLQWGFFDVDPVPDYPEYVAGFLVKLSPDEPEEVGDLATHELTLTNVLNRAIAKARFILHVDSGLVAHQHVSNHISGQTFRSRFTELFERAHDQMFVSAEIQVVERRYEFLATLSRFERIDEVTISLHPTNPHYDELYRSIDERLKQLNVKQYREQYLAGRNNDGLRPQEDEEIRRKAVMAEDGFGEAQVRGVLDGERTIVSTKQNPVSAAAVSRDMEARDVTASLLGVFQSIMDRITRE